MDGRKPTGNSFTVLGSASGMPNPRRAASGYLLQIGESLNLIDCGGGVSSSFLRCGFDPLKLDRIFISHTHSDHVAELTTFIQMLHGLQSKRRLSIFVPGEFVEPLEAYLRAVYLIRERLHPDLEIRGYSEGTVFDGEFKLVAVANSHISKLSAIAKELKLPNQLECYALRIEAGGKALLYSSDIGDLQDISAQLHDLEYALIETTHISVEAILELARGASIDHFVLTHLGDDHEVARLQKAVEESGLKNLRLTFDGMRLAL